jgi:hypothetical protein
MTFEEWFTFGKTHQTFEECWQAAWQSAAEAQRESDAIQANTLHGGEAMLCIQDNPLVPCPAQDEK